MNWTSLFLMKQDFYQFSCLCGVKSSRWKPQSMAFLSSSCNFLPNEFLSNFNWACPNRSKLSGQAELQFWGRCNVQCAGRGWGGGRNGGGAEADRGFSCQVAPAPQTLSLPLLSNTCHYHPLLITPNGPAHKLSFHFYIHLCLYTHTHTWCVWWEAN